MHLVHLIVGGREEAEDRKHEDEVDDDTDGYPDEPRFAEVGLGGVGLVAKGPDTEHDDVNERNREEK